MSFGDDDLEDLLRQLREKPEWREAVRREVLTDELLSLPDLVRQNSEDIRDLRTVVGDLQSVVRDLVTAMQALETRLARVEGRLGSLEGKVTEVRWRDPFEGRFGQLVRRTRLLTVRDLTAFEDAYDEGLLSEEEALAVRQLDVIVEGVRGRGQAQEKVLLAVEVSTNIEDHDIRRAIERAETLKKVGYNAVPVVAGARMDTNVAKRAELAGVEVLLREDDVAQIA